ncbi:MAG TPA: AraC family transcriptional regulator, partial [Anseongella sp.]|nr:AraC family transcriptional regulator [Anseongella sp.]
NGRVLQEYQLIYIPRGEGVFESDSCPQTRIREGAMIILFPNEWHRYKPDKATGWDEYWVGFKGGIIDNMVGNRFFEPKNPSLQIGVNERVVSIFDEIIENTKQEKSGYQPLISGAVVHLLGLIHSISREQHFEDQQMTVENIVNKARILFRSNIEQQISPEKIAHELGLSYSWFRKTFKAYTGIAPGQYLIQLKIEKAKQLLSDPSKSVKEIAYDLKFDSSFYFSKLFKEKTGLPPERYRKKIFPHLK